MDLFVGTLIATALCALALGVGVLFGAGPAESGCGRSGLGRIRCIGCPCRRGGSCGRDGSSEDRQ